MKLQTFAMTNIGLKRKNNQDAFLKDDSTQLYIIADGMGGHRGGEVASQLAVDLIQKYCKENPILNGREIMDNAINMSCSEIFKKSLETQDLSGMGTTVVAFLFQNKTVYIGQVGDSRAYLILPSGIWQVTEDHSLLNEEVRAGRLALADIPNYQFKNVITRSVGYESEVKVDIYRRLVAPGEIYVACTDGLSGLVETQEIGEAIGRAGIEAGVKNLVTLANQRGGDDNISVLACQVESV